MLTLVPFQTSSRTQAFQIEAEVLQSTPLNCVVRFLIAGPLNEIRWPSPDYQPQRKDELWQQTCLEVFLADSQEAQAPYLEVNISPAGNWNLYGFSSYREGMHLIPDGQVTLKRKNAVDSAQFQIEVAGTAENPLSCAFHGLSVILEFVDGEKSYWALSHGPEKADFHSKLTWKPR